jgi:hypothetical protein
LEPKVSILHITNGDAAVENICRAGIADDYLAWQAAFPEGPEPAGLAFEELRGVRIGFMVEQGWAPGNSPLVTYASSPPQPRAWRQAATSSAAGGPR